MEKFWTGFTSLVYKYEHLQTLLKRPMQSREQSSSRCLYCLKTLSSVFWRVPELFITLIKMLSVSVCLDAQIWVTEIVTAVHRHLCAQTYNVE